MLHDHNIVDAGKHFVIDPSLRTITTEASNLILVQGDHNSERYTFEIPQYVEGHDMSLCNRIEVHFDNISKLTEDISEGLYIANDAAANGDVVNFSWLISGNATRLAGTISFWLNFVCVDANGEVTYAWGTDVFKRVTVIESNRNTEEVVHTFPDLLQQWKKEIFDEIGDVGMGGAVSDEQLANAVNKYMKDNPVEGIPSGGKTGQYLRKQSDEDYDVAWSDLVIPEQYGLISYDQDKTITIT